MSLQVWLPLTGHLDNQGLSDITVTNNGATVDNSGKLGKCYLTNGSNQYISGTYNGTTNISFSAWVYMVTVKSGHIFDARNSDASGYQPIYVTSNSLQIGGSGTNFATFSYTWSANTWYHICVVHNATDGKLYVNGELIGTSTSAKGYNYGVKNFTLGCRCNQTSYTNVKLNDVRIYDHALSPKEVKLLSQGLVAHYTLDDRQVQVMTNCYVYPTFDTSASSGGWYHWGYSGHLGTYGQNTDKNYIFNVTNNYSHWVANGEGATGDYLCYQFPAFEGGTRSLCCIIKHENGLPITNSICYPAWNARSGGTPNKAWTSIISLDNGFYLCRCENIQQDGSNDLVGIYVTAGNKIYISECYLENDRPCCSDMFYNDTIVYDSSGYNYHGTKTGDLTVSSDTSRYSLSTHFNGTGYSYLTSISPEIVSISLWVKWDSIPSGQSVVFMDYKSKIGFGLMSTGILCGSVSGTYNTFNKSNIVANTWYHFVIVSPDGASSTTRKLYINGVEQTPTSYTSVWSYSIDELQIGRRSYTSDGFVGKISDFRAYATALSADDILELYQAPVSVSNNGSLLTQGEFMEVG